MLREELACSRVGASTLPTAQDGFDSCQSASLPFCFVFCGVFVVQKMRRERNERKSGRAGIRQNIMKFSERR